MEQKNYIDKDYLIIERPNIYQECNFTSEEEFDNYVNLYNVYNNLLVQYVMKKLNLYKEDIGLFERRETFPCVNDDDKDLYQYASNGYMKYIYIRNNIYIERLSKNEIQYLFGLLSQNNSKLTDESEKFIEKTIKNVITELPGEKIVNINYGPNNGKFFKPSNGLILGIRYDTFSNLKNDESGKNKFFSNEAKISILCEYIEHKAKKMIDIPVYVIEYDEYSIKKKSKLGYHH